MAHVSAIGKGGKLHNFAVKLGIAVLPPVQQPAIPWLTVDYNHPSFGSRFPGRSSLAPSRSRLNLDIIILMIRLCRAEINWPEYSLRPIPLDAPLDVSAIPTAIPSPTRCSRSRKLHWEKDPIEITIRVRCANLKSPPLSTFLEISMFFLSLFRFFEKPKLTTARSKLRVHERESTWAPTKFHYCSRKLCEFAIPLEQSGQTRGISFVYENRCGSFPLSVLAGCSFIIYNFHGIPSLAVQTFRRGWAFTFRVRKRGEASAVNSLCISTQRIDCDWRDFETSLIFHESACLIYLARLTRFPEGQNSSFSRRIDSRSACIGFLLNNRPLNAKHRSDRRPFRNPWRSSITAASISKQYGTVYTAFRVFSSTISYFN